MHIEHTVSAITIPESKTNNLSVGNLAFIATKNQAFGFYSTSSYGINKNQNQNHIFSGSISYSYKNSNVPAAPGAPLAGTKPVVISTPFSGSFVLPSITRTTIKKTFTVSGYKAVEDILYLQNVVIEQLESWTDGDEKDEQLNLFKNDLIRKQEYDIVGKPFVGIVTDIHKTELNEKNHFIKLWNMKYFRILFEDNKHYWFSEVDVRPMYDI